MQAVISAGEVLYLPSYWFHYIVSQDASIQCNARSGDSVVGREEIEKCGFYSENSVDKVKERKKMLRMKLRREEEEENGGTEVTERDTE